MDAPLFSELLKEASGTDIKNMEENGYCLYTSAQRPEESLLQDIEDSIGSHIQPGTTPPTYFDSADRPKAVKELWKNFVNYGINVSTLREMNFDSAV